MLANQNSDVNWAASILEDESRCEYTVGSDFFMTSSMKYCDLILPESMPQEGLNLAAGLSSGSCATFTFGQKVQDAPGECRTEFEWLADIAERFGVYDEFTDGGMTPDEKVLAGYQIVYESGNYPTLPTYEDGVKMDVWSEPRETAPQFAAFREDPEANPLSTPSGKVEIYSEGLANIAATWEFDDPVHVFNDRGELQIEVRVTPRIVPGAVAMEEGRNRLLDENGVDVGGCINTLVSHHWSPLAKHNPSNSIRAQVQKL